ncbi:MAG: AAA family ATPase, partial [Dolichospermum sp.]
MNNPHQQLLQQIDLMLRARYPLLYIVGVEEEPIEQVLQQLTQISQTPRQLLLWDIVTGWDDNGSDKGSVMGALSRITKTSENTTTIFVLRDIHFILKNSETEKNAPVIRAIKNLTRQLKRTRQT